MKCLLLVSILFILNYTAANGQALYNLKIHADLPYLNRDNKLFQDVYYSTDGSMNGTLLINCYKLNINDSLLVFSKRNINILLKEGITTENVNLDLKDTNTYCNKSFYNIVKKAEVIPAGDYKTYIVFIGSNGTQEFIILNHIDSTFSPTSALRKDINKSLLRKKRSFLGISSIDRIGSSTGIKSILSNSNKQLQKAVKSRGLTQVIHQKNNRTIIDLFYQDWFVGKYELENNVSIAKQIKQQEQQLTGGVGSLTTNELDNRPSLFSQFRKIKKEKKDDEKIMGEISLGGSFSNGQEPNSDQDNNYTEIRGSIEIPVMGMPVDLEGMYTTQDAHRQAKASYVHIHYDVDKAKSELSQLISQYDNVYEQTINKGKGIDQVYKTYLSNLENQRGNTLAELKGEIGMSQLNGTAVNMDSLKQIAIASAIKAKGDSADEKKIKDSVGRAYSKYQEKYTKLQELEQKILKYQTLLAQYKNTNYFDSALAYQKVKDLNNTEQLSYKQLAKRADDLLPSGKAKSFASGVTNFDAGMFSQYQSKYTMSGQMMKGLSMGYDFGICQTAFSLGKTQYIASDGSVDQYTSYSAQVSAKPYKDQKLALIYYGYMPSKQMLSDPFFKNMDIATPSFRNPVHIISMDYTGLVSQYVKVNAEAATSINSSDNNGLTGNVSAGDKMAYDVDVEANIPHSTISLTADYSKAGNGFQNNSLPISPAGTEQYKLAGQGDFFKDFLTLGLEYNYILQSNYAYSGGNKRWGFNVQTHSRKYPSLSFSYKPFSTFSSYSDTLSIPQRPMIGAVWTGKASYQLKRAGGKTWRFMLMYNKNTSTMDTVKYGSDLFQAVTMYTVKKYTVSLTAGSMQINNSNVENTSAVIITTPAKMWFTNANVNYTLNKQVNLTCEQDLGFADFGFCRYSAMGGVVYHFTNKPLIARISLRYSDYELDQADGWKSLYSGYAELTWQFKCKMKAINN